MKAEARTIEDLLSRGVAEIIGGERLHERLLAGEKLRIKFGIDPTSPNLHLGRAVPLLKLRDFQEAGHQVVFIVGDFTAEIGDTSDKESERPMLSREDVAENLKTYVAQAATLLDMERVEVRHNSMWLSALGYEEIGRQADAFSVAEFTARENIRKRLDQGKRVSLREMLYPLMQGYDSVAVEADLEIGGTDQRFNMLAGRSLQERYGQRPQAVMMTDLILGTDGRKMSSSWGNTINLTDTPREMFGKVMSLPDELILSYFVHCTRLAMGEVAEIKETLEGGSNPRDAKLRLAREIVRLYHSEQAAEEAETYFVETFSKKTVPEDIREETVEAGTLLADALTDLGLAESKSDAKRKIEQGGVEFSGEKVTAWQRPLTKSDDSAILKVGKKDFVRLKVL